MELRTTTIGTDMILKKMQIFLKKDRFNTIMLQQAENARNMIIDRVIQGEMINGKPFPDYSPQWAKVRQRSGRSLNKDRLIFTGKMLGNMKAIKTWLGAVLKFTSSGIEPQAMGNQLRTPFFGLTQNELTEINKDLQEYFRGVVSGQNRT